jgi:hypothetical protein
MECRLLEEVCDMDSGCGCYILTEPVYEVVNIESIDILPKQIYLINHAPLPLIPV